MKISGQRRKAISPIVATVLIIAATLIAFAAVLGYIFGIFGSSANTANISASSPSISHSFTAETSYPTTAATYGTIVLSNTGTANTTVSSGTISFGSHTFALLVGSSGTASCTSATPCTVGSGKSFTLYVYINAGTTTATSGEAFNGVIDLANGEQASFTGTFS